MISILDAFVLRLEKEEELFLQMNDVLHQKLKDIKSKYQIGLSIEKFLKEISKFEDPTERENAIKEFRERPIFNKTKKMGDFFNVDLDSSDENKIAYEIKISKNLEYMLPDNAVSALYQATDAVNSLGEKAIVSAIQYFEEFFTCILRKLIVEKPNLYFGKKTIEYQELMKYDNIETIKQKFIDTEVNSLMHGVRETINLINDRHNLNLSKYSELWDMYNRIDCHRNIIIHNRGCVNTEYNNGVCKSYKKDAGTYINCDNDLVHESINALIKFAYLLYYITGTKESELEVLDKVAFDLLCKEKWELAEFAYSLLKIHKPISHENKMNYEINYLNSLKHIKGLDSVKEQIDQLDVSGMSEQFDVAKNLLLENHQYVLDNLCKVYPDHFNMYAILNWPIFIEFRKSKEYKQFIAQHSNAYEIYQIDVEENSEEQ